MTLNEKKQLLEDIESKMLPVEASIKHNVGLSTVYKIATEILVSKKIFAMIAKVVMIVITKRLMKVRLLISK